MIKRVSIPAILILFLLAACGRPAPTPAPSTPTPTLAPTLTPSPTPAYQEPAITVVAEGLLAPLGLAALPGGSLLVAEEGTGERDDSAGVLLLVPGGEIGRLISGFPSSRDAGDLAGVNRVVPAPDGTKLYIATFGQGHLWTLPLNPTQQEEGLSLPGSPLAPEQLEPEMLPLNSVRLINPFDITFDEQGTPVVSDASQNGVAKMNPDGTTRFIHRFDQLPNPVKPTDPIEAVPTGIERVGEEYYVTLTGGCPFPEGAGQLVAIDESRNQRTVVSGLNMPIDVARGPDGTIWLLEFARFTPGASCFDGSGYQARTGRLSRLLPDGTLEPVLLDLNFPGAVLPMADGTLYLSEVFTGRLLHVTFGGSEQGPPSAEPEATRDTGEAPPRIEVRLDEYDRMLQQIIEEQGLSSQPGAELREPETPLARLGQELFFDPILSGDQNIACSTCHHPLLAMADGRVLPIGTGGQGLGPERTFGEQVVLGPEASQVRRLAGSTDPASGQTTVHNPFVGAFVPRNSPTILNSVLLPRQFWDSRVERYGLAGMVRSKDDIVNEMNLTDVLAAQALFPVTSLHEMAGATFGALPPHTIREELVDRLRSMPAYVERFTEVFGPAGDRPEEAITLLRLIDALAAFERRLIFTDAPWDRYLAGDQGALSPQQKRGALLFFGAIDPKINCASCHSGDLFTDLEHHNLLAPQLGPGKGHGYTGREDWGRGGVTFDPRDRYAFRTPSLRNVELTPPYFHSGAYATLANAIRHHADMWGHARHYDPSDHNIPPALYSSLRPFEPEKQGSTAAPELREGLPLREEDLPDLVAFLTTLTDPAARDLSGLLLDEVPSGLPVDPLPEGPLPSLATLLDGPVAEPVEQEEPLQETGEQALQLRDVAAEVGLDFQHEAFQTAIFQDPAAAMGGGLCWVDYDGDGWLDLYLVNSHAEDEQPYWNGIGALPHNRLYRNQEGTFQEVSEESGSNLQMRGNGCVAADFNLDGHMDLFVTADGPNALLWNNGDGTFNEGALAAGIAAPEWNSAAAVGDVNGDGWPDLFVAAYIDLDHKIPKPSGAFPQDYYGLPDRLYLNEGTTGTGPAARVTFHEVTRPAGLVREERSLGALFSDLDGDGRLDLYIANDGQPNRLYHNVPWSGGQAADPQGLGFRYVDVTDSADVGDSGSGMGIAGGDYDGDSQVDLFVTNWERELNALYRNESDQQGELAFQYSTFRIGISGLGNGLTGWGTSFLDIDHDTDNDLLVVNGRVPVTNLRQDAQLVRLYRNRSSNLEGRPPRPGHFIEWTEQVGLAAVGPLNARGSAVADYDNDGDLDVAVATIAGRAALLQNEGPTANWLQVDLAGFFPGARAVVELPDGRRLVRELYVGSSYLASEDPRLHFGLGDATHVTRLTLHLPDGRELVRENLHPNQRLVMPTGP